MLQSIDIGGVTELWRSRKNQWLERIILHPKQITKLDINSTRYPI